MCLRNSLSRTRPYQGLIKVSDCLIAVYGQVRVFYDFLIFLQTGIRLLLLCPLVDRLLGGRTWRSIDVRAEVSAVERGRRWGTTVGDGDITVCVLFLWSECLYQCADYQEAYEYRTILGQCRLYTQWLALLCELTEGVTGRVTPQLKFWKFGFIHFTSLSARWRLYNYRQSVTDLSKERAGKLDIIIYT